MRGCDHCTGYRKLLILRNLLQRPWRFNKLKKDLDGISQKVLSDCLRFMEAGGKFAIGESYSGTIDRTVLAEVPPRAEYILK